MIWVWVWFGAFAFDFIWFWISGLLWMRWDWFLEVWSFSALAFWDACLTYLGMFDLEGFWPFGIFARVFLARGFGLGRLGCVRDGALALGLGCCDEPESLILAQSERWRHA